MHANRAILCAAAPALLIVALLAGQRTPDTVAHWSFEPGAVTTNDGGELGLDLLLDREPAAFPGVHGSALWLQGSHALRAAEGGLPALEAGITLAA